MTKIKLMLHCPFCHCLYPLLLQIPLGLGTAASVQVGNALGAGDIEVAKRSSSTSMLCTGQQQCSAPFSLCPRPPIAIRMHSPPCFPFQGGFALL